MPYFVDPQIRLAKNHSGTYVGMIDSKNRIFNQNNEFIGEADENGLLIPQLETIFGENG